MWRSLFFVQMRIVECDERTQAAQAELKFQNFAHSLTDIWIGCMNKQKKICNRHTERPLIDHVRPNYVINYFHCQCCSIKEKRLGARISIKWEYFLCWTSRTFFISSSHSLTLRSHPIISRKKIHLMFSIHKNSYSIQSSYKLHT